MNENTFQIVTSGELVGGFALDQVKTRVAQLFKAPPEKIAPLFSGQQISVKKGLDEATAHKYQQALKSAGLITHIGKPAAAPAKPSALAQASIAAPGEQLDRQPAPSAPQIDTSALSMAAVGEDITEQRTVAPPTIDTSTISMAQIGEDLSRHKAPPAPDIDISALSLGSVGEDITQHTPAPEPKYDLSAISIAPPGSDIGEKDDTPPAPIPDTSHIKLE